MKVQTDRESKRHCKVIAFTSQKGGVGKTTSCLIAGYGLAERGHKVLIVDADPQASISFLLHSDRGPGIAEALKKTVKLEESIYIKNSLLHVARGSQTMAEAGEAFSYSKRKETALKEAMEPLLTSYDYILIDCPPALNLVTVNALTASDSVIVPVMADILSLKGVEGIAALTQAVKARTNPGIKISGFLLNRYNSRNKVSKAVRGQLEKAAERLGTEIIPAPIREATALKETQITGENPFSVIKKSAPVYEDMTAFIDWMEDEEK